MKPVILLRKLNLITGQNALDVGARDCSTSVDLAKEGFHVDAVDIKECLTTINADNINFVRSRFEDFCPDKKYDLCVARHVLPFLIDSIEFSIQRLTGMLSEGGVLYFTVFGDEDGWLNQPNIKITNLDSINKIVTKHGKIAYKGEERFEGKTYLGVTKKWHIITIVLVKE